MLNEDYLDQAFQAQIELKRYKEAIELIKRHLDTWPCENKKALLDDVEAIIAGVCL